jgi:hypothetical protein
MAQIEPADANRRPVIMTPLALPNAKLRLDGPPFRQRPGSGDPQSPGSEQRFPTGPPWGGGDFERGGRTVAAPQSRRRCRRHEEEMPPDEASDASDLAAAAQHHRTVLDGENSENRGQLCGTALLGASSLTGIVTSLPSRRTTTSTVSPG